MPHGKCVSETINESFKLIYATMNHLNHSIENLDFVFFNHILIISRKNTGRGSIIHLHHFTNHETEVNKPSTDVRIETLPHQRLSWAATSDLLSGEFFSGELKSRFDGNNEEEET